GNAGLEELLWRQRQLITQLRLTLPPRAAHVEMFAPAKSARELTVDEGRQPAIDAVGRELVGRAHDVDESLDEGSLIRAEGLIAGNRRSARCRRRRLCLCGDDARGGCRRGYAGEIGGERGARHSRKRLEDVPARERPVVFARHAFLPDL